MNSWLLGLALAGLAEAGILEGVVTFLGTPCYSQEVSGRKPRVPPCSGPYPNYEITIYKADAKSIAAKTVTDSAGDNKVSLNPGKYVIYAQNGPLEQDRKAHQLTISAKKRTRLHLVIDTGVR